MLNIHCVMLKCIQLDIFERTLKHTELQNLSFRIMHLTFDGLLLCIYLYMLCVFLCVCMIFFVCVYYCTFHVHMCTCTCITVFIAITLHTHDLSTILWKNTYSYVYTCVYTYLCATCACTMPFECTLQLSLTHTQMYLH